MNLRNILLILAAVVFLFAAGGIDSVAVGSIKVHTLPVGLLFLTLAGFAWPVRSNS